MPEGETRSQIRLFRLKHLEQVTMSKECESEPLLRIPEVV